MNLGKFLWNKYFYRLNQCGICGKEIKSNDVVCVTYFMRKQYHISYRTLYHRSCYAKKYDEI